MTDLPYVPESRRMHHHTINSKLLKELIDGPKTTSEIDISWTSPLQAGTDGKGLRDIVFSLSPIKSGHGHPPYPSAERVIFLWGDDRQAIRKYIEVNEENISAVLERSNGQAFNNTLGEDMTELLYEEWQFKRNND